MRGRGDWGVRASRRRAHHARIIAPRSHSQCSAALESEWLAGLLLRVVGLALAKRYFRQEEADGEGDDGKDGRDQEDVSHGAS